MALSVDLFGMAADGTVAWRWMCRLWNGREALEIAAPSPADQSSSWEGPITHDQIEHLRMKAGGRDAERKFRGLDDRDLDELLAIPVQQVVIRVEEWGFG